MENTIALQATRRLHARSAVLTDLSLIVFGSLLLAALAQVRFYLPFTPVPVTGQTFGVLLIGALLGSRRGASAVALYIAEGSLGLPFFAGGKAGVAALLGPTGGYLVGFIAAAFVIGYLAERGLDRRFRTALPAFLIGELVIFTCGALWLAFFVGAQNALTAGVLPFLPGDALKVVLAGCLLPAAWKWVKNL